jgi:hypothetical protein
MICSRTSELTVKESATLHITDGESVAGTLRESAVPGVVSVYGDMMFEGPAPAGLDADAWIETRARFMAEADYCSLEEARQYLRDFENTLAAFPKHEEVVIWVDHRLSNQLILIKLLDWFGRRDLGELNLSLICVGPDSGLEHFVGLGALTADQLASLAETRLPVAEAHVRTAQAAWTAFTSPDPTDIERFIKGDTSALPYIAAALRRHLEEFPALDSGLSRTERQALSFLRDHRDDGSLSGERLCIAVWRQEEAVFMGDSSFFRMMANLSQARHPLVRISDPSPHSLGDVTITETGRRTLEGRADHIALNGIDRWLGGVHLKGDKAIWRWDRASKRIVSHQ